MTTLHATIDRTDAHSPSPTVWADIPGFSTVESIAGTGSVVLLIALMQNNSGTGSDETFECRFTIDGSSTGSPIPLGYKDAADEASGTQAIWAVDGLSTGNHTFAVQAKDAKNSSQISTRTRSFQVIEFPAADATLLVDKSSTATQSASSTWTTLTDLSATVTPASGSLLIFLASITPRLDTTGDTLCQFRFTVDGTRDGPYCYAHLDANSEATSCGMLWFETGHSATSQVLGIQSQTHTGDLIFATDRLRTFQVIEYTGTFDLAVDVLTKLPATPASAPTPYADMDNMTGSITPTDTNTVTFIVSVGTADGSDSDNVAHARIADGGTREGAELMWWTDSATIKTGFMHLRVKDGITGSHTFSLMWEDVKGDHQTDPDRERSFQVCSFDAAVAAAVYPPFPRRQNTLVRM